ncbi:MAG: flagellar basal body-associated protein FliL [Verrucomicrobiales bacterium]|nr:flagellar basal body-associated protein FliL [Verrucomicrobiales bacterium]
MASKEAPKVEAPKAENGSVAMSAKTVESSGIKPWLPLIVTLVSMPLLAFAVTQFVLLPRLKLSPASALEHSDGKEKPKEEGKAEGGKAGKVKYSVALNKMIVNLSGTMGTRYLMSSVTLAGYQPDFKAKIDENKDQLLDLATGALSGKTISDLEKPGARNQIRAELLSLFNNALGNNLIQEIYITELAIQ